MASTPTDWLTETVHGPQCVACDRCAARALDHAVATGAGGASWRDGNHAAAVVRRRHEAVTTVAVEHVPAYRVSCSECGPLARYDTEAQAAQWAEHHTSAYHSPERERHDVAERLAAEREYADHVDALGSDEVRRDS